MSKHEQPFFHNWKKFFSISVGTALVLFYLFLLFNTSKFVPVARINEFWMLFVSYFFILALGIALPDARAKFFNIQLRKYFPRFLFSFGIFLVIFFIVLAKINPFLNPDSAWNLFNQVPWWLKILHAFVFAVIENLFWFSYLDEKIGRPASEITGGIFHVFVWKGTAFFNIIFATLLFLGFSYIHWRFRKNKSDTSVVDGCHTAYNFIKLALTGS